MRTSDGKAHAIDSETAKFPFETAYLPIHLPIQSSTVELILRWCQQHKNDFKDDEAKCDQVSDWDLSFFTSLTRSQLFELILV